MNQSDQTHFISLVKQLQPKKSDAIVFLTGDLFHRIPKVVELFRAGYAPNIVITSNAYDPAYGSLPSGMLVPELLKQEVPLVSIIFEETASHTRAEADSTFRIAKEKGWSTLLLVTTEYHQYRALLSWIKAMQDHGLHLILLLAPVEEFPSFRNETYEEALVREFERIAKYQEKGDVAQYEDGIKYVQSVLSIQ